ncbi:MAG TPA: histidine kinase [Agriterribacter sp.]|nr:histidine kinase [Chitinophagaceae bacterium]HRP33370.1 histidine kinase [Agriterribacter sp.]
MKKYIVTLALFFFTSVAAVAQQPVNPATDSLKKMLAGNDIADTLRAKLLLNLVKLNLVTESDSVLENWVLQAIRLSEKQDWNPGKALGYQRLGVIYSYLRADYPTAIKHYNHALQYAQSDSTLIFGSYANIAQIYYETGLLQKCFENYQKVINLLPAGKKGSVEEAQLYVNIANALTENGNADSALALYNKYGDKMLGTPYHLVVQLNRAQVMNMQENYQDALNLLEVTDTNQVKDPGPVRFLYLVNLSAAQAGVGKLQPALVNANRALELAELLDNNKFREYAYKTLVTVYKESGDYARGMEAMTKYGKIREQVVNESKIREIAFLESQGEFDRQAAIEKLLHETAIEKEKNIRYATLGGAAFLLIAGAGLFYAFKKRKESQQAIEQSRFNEELAHTELKALRAQINPHFLFNSLNSIANYIDNQQAGTASQYATKFAKLMRMILESSEKKEVSLEDDLKTLELYMQLEALRMNNRYSYEIVTDDGLDTETTMIPPLLLQPFVENSIWHGLAKKEEPGKISVRITKEGEMINCRIEDNGIGRAASTLHNDQKKDKKSLGMKITEARIALMNKLKNTNGGVYLTDLPQGLRVELKLPYETKF